MAGVDGWRNGWVVVTLVNGAFDRAWPARTAADVIEGAARAAVIGIDIPIGLPALARRADVEARALLGPRRSSVFITPPREILDIEPYDLANTTCKERFGFGISRQVYGLRGKMLEVDRLADGRLHEVHPELAFREMAGRVLASKKTWDGVAQRRTALTGEGIGLPDDLGAAGSVPVDDVLDAAAAAWTAHRIARGIAESVPEHAEHDPHGRPMAIWF